MSQLQRALGWVASNSGFTYDGRRTWSRRSFTSSASSRIRYIVRGEQRL
jgi:hypothetical protein